MTPATVSRVNYFDGEALLRSDFDAEQAYHKGARERLSAGLLRTGVVSGMDVTWSAQAPTQVTVTAGMVQDCKGREVVLLADQVVTLDALTDGKQNFLTVSYGELLAVGSDTPTMEFKRIEEAPFFNCTPDYDPTGPDVLLAVIEAQGGNIQAVRYQYGNYSRRHVGAALGEVEFVLESDTAPPGIEHGGNGSQRMAISAQQDDLTGERYLDISAPEIRFDGNVQAAGEFSGQFDGTVNGHATLDGTFTGTFTGNGSGLTGVKATGYWQQNTDGSLFYTGGNVGINDAQPTALLTVGQPVNSHIGRGLMTATKIDQGIATVEGYQTNFTSDMVGKILQFGVVLKQQATIASVDGDDSLTLDESFPLGLGPTTYGYILASSGQTTETQGAGMITPDGKTVTASGGAQFKSQLKLNTGDVLVIDRFVPQQQVITSKISGAPVNDTSLTLTQAFSEDVTNSAYLYSTEPDRWITGQGTISSVGTQVTGVGTTFTQLPAGATLRAMAALDIASVPQTWRIASVLDPKHLTMRKISIEDGSPLLPMSSAFMMTTWQLMRVGGELQPATPPALTVVQNNGIVPNTVAINVDDRTVPINSRYALQVNGPAYFEGGSLDVDGDLTVEGALDVKRDSTLEGKLDVKGDSTLAGKLDVKGDSTLEGKLDVKGDSTLEGMLDVKGDSTLEGMLNVKSAATLDTTLEVKGDTTLDGKLEVKSAATLDTTLEVKGDTTLDGTLNGAQNKVRIKQDMNVTGNVTMGGTIAGTNGALEVSGGAKVDDALEVDGNLIVGTSSKSVEAEIYGDLTVTGKIHGPVDIPDTLQGPLTIDGDLTVTGSIDCQSYCFGSITTETHRGMGAGTLPAVGPTANDQFVLINITGAGNQTENGDVVVYISITPSRGDQYGASTHFTDTSDNAPIWGATATAPIPKGSTYQIGVYTYKLSTVDFDIIHIPAGKLS
jgi:cytoskeletal protein CcmA (bactofilin family)